MIFCTFTGFVIRGFYLTDIPVTRDFPLREGFGIDVAPGFSSCSVLRLSAAAQDNIRKKILKVIVKKRGPHSELKNVSIEIGDASGFYNIYIGYHNAEVYIDNAVTGSYDLRLWRDSRIEIGEGTSSNGIRIECDNSNFTCGRDCMFSDGILVQGNDQHAIVDLQTGEILNLDRKENALGDHVWLGRGSTVMAGVSIGSGSIVATGSVVTKNVPENSIAAGVPAKIVKSGVSWSRSPSKLDAFSRKLVESYEA